MEKHYGNFQSLSRQLPGLRPLHKPLWLGEIPAGDSFDRVCSLDGALTECLNRNLFGAAVWRGRNRKPQESTL